MAGKRPDERTLPTWVVRWHHGYRTTNYGLAGGVLHGAVHIERARNMDEYNRVAAADNRALAARRVLGAFPELKEAV